MKNSMKVLSVILMAGFLLTFNSCEKVADLVPIPSMTATVDGVEWKSIFRASVLFEGNQMMTITGTPEASENVDKAIILSIYGTAAGTYNLSPGTLVTECLVAYKKTAGAVDGDDNYYVSHTASITITSIDLDKKKISGTFSATLIPTGGGVDEISITNGKFENLTYQTQP